MKRTRFYVTAAIAAACALAGAAGGIAGGSAATNSSGSGAAANPGTGGSGTRQAPPRGRRPGGRHVGANGKREQPLSGDVAAKVRAAALAKVNGTVLRVETDVDHGSPYEAHIRKADGSEVEVLVNSSFDVTAVNAMGPMGPPPGQQQ